MVKGTLRFLRDLFFLAGDWVVMKSVKQSGVASGVLLVRLDAIGDFVVWLDSAKEFRRCFPGEKITLLANSSWADLAKHIGYWDEVISVSLNGLVKTPLYRWGTIRQVRKGCFDIAVQSQFSRVFLAGDSIVRASGARERITSVGDYANIGRERKRLSDRWFTCVLPISAKPLMEIERNAEFISALTGKQFTPHLSSIPVLYDLPINLLPQRPYFIVFPGASVKYRQWPIEMFAEVIRYLYRKYGLLPVLCGSPSEKPLCAKLALIADVTCLDFSGHTTLPELVEVIRGSSLLVSNETSAVHIAAAVGTPSICILGGGHYGRFMPYPEYFDGAKPLVAMTSMDCLNCNWKCIHTNDRDEAYPCIASVSVEQVMACVGEIIDGY